MKISQVVLITNPKNDSAETRDNAQVLLGYLCDLCGKSQVRILEGFSGTFHGLNHEYGQGFFFGPGHTGCNLSHFAAWQMLLRSGLRSDEYVAIFEADAVATHTPADLGVLMTCAPDCDVAYLYASDAAWYDPKTYEMIPSRAAQKFGKRPLSRKMQDPVWYRLPNPLTTCAMVFRLKVLETLYKEMNLRSPIDRIWNKVCHEHNFNVIVSDLFKHGHFESTTFHNSGKKL